MSTWVVGDVQGCLPALEHLLAQVGFAPGRDVLWSVGDIVNRGPRCLETLRFFYERREHLRMVLGNHDLHLLAAANGVRPLGRSDTLAAILDAPDAPQMLEWLRRQPLIWQEHGVTLVHAGIPPQWRTAEAAERAREVEATLRGPDYRAFLGEMYGNEPRRWRDELSGHARLRVITNYFTRMRFCTARGKLDLVSKGPLHAPGGPAMHKPQYKAWFAHAGRAAADEVIVFGHWASLEGKTGVANAIALDTGCVWGGAMTLYCLETGERVQCECQNGAPRAGGVESSGASRTSSPDSAALHPGYAESAGDADGAAGGGARDVAPDSAALHPGYAESAGDADVAAGGGTRSPDGAEGGIRGKPTPQSHTGAQQHAPNLDDLEVYLVGGAVRDGLLGVPCHERDWVVVGATPQVLLDRGFKQVGKDFPVFLHPHTREEYALARTERKQGHGYTGFAVDCAPTVTLEDDLMRRDLSVNAMARCRDGKLIDPWGGRQDIEARVLRHVSPAFVEDPLRVLRVARFAARYAGLGFAVAPQTRALMADIVARGELAHLPAERIWVETERALREAAPEVFFEELRACGALRALFPEVDALFGVPQRADYHPEIDTGVHTMMVLQQAARLSQDVAVRWAALLHDLGKAATPEDVLPSHRGHESRGLPLVRALCARLKVPKRHSELALVCCEYHLLAHRARELRGSTLLKLLHGTGALRSEARFRGFLCVCEADARGRGGAEDAAYPQASYLRRAREVAQQVNVQQFLAQGLKGEALGSAIAGEQTRQLEALRKSV